MISVYDDIHAYKSNYIDSKHVFPDSQINPVHVYSALNTIGYACDAIRNGSVAVNQ